MGPLTTTVAGAAAILRQPTAAVIDMIHDGRIQWAINVASSTSRRPEIRIPIRSLINFMAGNNDEITPDDLAASMFGGRITGTIMATRFYMALSITHSHFYKLVAEGSIKTEAPARRGPAGAPIISVAEALNFIIKRRIL
jgi:hypothetical protein